jgi:hypothetical protein
METMMATTMCAWGGEFCQVSIFAKLVCQTVGDQFFLFCQNYMDAKLVCQTVGVALSLFFLPSSRMYKTESKLTTISPPVIHIPITLSDWKFEEALQETRASPTA